MYECMIIEIEESQRKDVKTSECEETAVKEENMLCRPHINIPHIVGQGQEYDNYIIDGCILWQSINRVID